MHNTQSISEHKYDIFDEIIIPNGKLWKRFGPLHIYVPTKEYILALKITPAPFARRNIFCSNRLFQNKYEMYEWTQEAKAKSITNPREIRQVLETLIAFAKEDGEPLPSPRTYISQD